MGLAALPGHPQHAQTPVVNWPLRAHGCRSMDWRIDRTRSGRRILPHVQAVTESDRAVAECPVSSAPTGDSIILPTRPHSGPGSLQTGPGRGANHEARRSLRSAASFILVCRYST